jgi:hypothetical protein
VPLDQEIPPTIAYRMINQVLRFLNVHADGDQRRWIRPATMVYCRLSEEIVCISASVSSALSGL